MKKSTHTPEYGRLRERLVRLRAAAGLSQRELAVKLRVPHSRIAKVESGERRLDLVEFGWFCEGCDTSPGEQAAAFFGTVTPSRRGSARKRGG